MIGWLAMNLWLYARNDTYEQELIPFTFSRRTRACVCWSQRESITRSQMPKRKREEMLVSLFQRHFFSPCMQHTLLPFIDLQGIVLLSELTRELNQFCRKETSLWNNRCTHHLNAQPLHYLNPPLYARGCVATMRIHMLDVKEWTSIMTTYSNVHHINFNRPGHMGERSHTYFSTFLKHIPPSVSSVRLERQLYDIWQYSDLPLSVHGILLDNYAVLPHGENRFPNITSLTATYAEHVIHQFPHVQFLYCTANVNAFTLRYGFIDTISVRFLIIDYPVKCIPDYFRDSLQHLRFGADYTSHAMDALMNVTANTTPYRNLETIELFVEEYNARTLRLFIQQYRRVFPTLKRIHIVWRCLFIGETENVVYPIIQDGVEVIVEQVGLVACNSMGQSLDMAFGKGPLGTAKQAFFRYSQM